jgi:GAF domain-containing protein
MTMTVSESSTSTNRLRRALAAPQFVDSDKTQTAQYLNAILIAGALLLGLRVFIGALQNGGILPTDLLLVGLIGALIALLAIMRRGYVKAASVILLGITFVGMVYIASTSDGIFDGSFAALIALVIMAGLLLGWKASLVMAALGSTAGWWLANQVAGRPLKLEENAPIIYARDVTIVFILIGFLTYLLINSLRQALEHSRVSEQAMRAQNAELTQMRGALEDRVTERTLQLRAAADVGHAAVSILDPDQLLSEIVNVIAERFGLYYAAIFTLDRTGSYLVLREATGEAGRTLKERGHRLRVRMDSMVGYAALRHEPRVALNVREDTVHFANPLLPDTQSEVALPLLVGQEVIGALDVQSTQLNAFDEGTLTALQAMASQVAVALQNAQSFQDLQKTLDYTTRQYELSRNIFLAQTPNEAYLTLGQVFAMFADVDRIQLLRVIERDANNQPAVYEIAIEWDILGGAQMDTGMSYAAAKTPLAALVAEDEAVVIRDANDMRLPATTRERLAQANAQAVILAPLLIGAEYSGFVAAISEQPREFADNEVRLLKSTAEQLGVVLTNLQLTAEMRTTVERVALLNRRLSGEAWDSYRAGRAQLRVESGHVEFLAPEHQLQVPIVVRGETIGAFNIADNNREREWNEDELSILQTIAEEVALAIDNARLIEQTQRTASRERAINEINARVRQTIDLDAILRTAVNELGQSLKAARVTARINVADNSEPGAAGSP